MEFILKYRWALIGTFFLHLVLMIYMQNKTIPRPYQPVGELEIPIVLEDPEDIKPEDKDAQKLQPDKGKITNITANASDKTGESNKRYDSRSLDEQVEKELRDFEKNAFNELASNRKTDVTINDDKDKSKAKDKTKDNTANANDASNVRPVGRVSGSYDLGGRRDEYFAKPAYVCKGSGTIVLKIKVNRNGKVVAAEIDQSQSSYTESCMGENSLTYVRKCKFEAGTQWPDPQSGTVTYTFVAQ